MGNLSGKGLTLWGLQWSRYNRQGTSICSPSACGSPLPCHYLQENLGPVSWEYWRSCPWPFSLSLTSSSPCLCSSASPSSPGEGLFYHPFQADASLPSLWFSWSHSPLFSAASCLTINHSINYYSHYCLFDAYIQQLSSWSEPMTVLVWTVAIASSPISLAPVQSFFNSTSKVVHIKCQSNTDISLLQTL